ncbi:hypothetical protein GCM10023331_24610 [Algivirga pacifica]|uniref:Peptidase S54 rhomboid domain-containing protein n=2 Tax=Algivirga pacifica TaxID=1162670 RepID=A0ABP9DCZ3_9BACT
MLYGILPAQPGVSWESHLMGGFSGLIVAYYFRNYQTEAFQHITTKVEDIIFEGYENIETEQYKYTFVSKEASKKKHQPPKPSQ